MSSESVGVAVAGGSTVGVVSDLPDASWLRERIVSGASITEIAEETGRRPRTVWAALRRHGISTPTRHARAQVDRNSVLAAWKRGDHVDDIAAAHGRSVAWVRDAVRNVPRDVAPPRRPRPSRFPELNDPTWLQAQLDSGRSIGSIAREVGTDRHNVSYMLDRYACADPWREASGVLTDL